MAQVDINGAVWAALRDLSAAQRSVQSRWGYKRAAAAVRRLEQSIMDLMASGALPRIPGELPRLIAWMNDRR